MINKEASILLKEAIIKKYKEEGFSELDILEKITGYRTSSATIYTKRIYSLIKRVFK